MPLVIGTRLGPYEIVSALGAGGMGEVYRARDTKLDRDVAIKILPDAFAADAERVARFEREAKTLAALNHPHIAQIYGLEESNGVRALVMELVEGPTLAEKLASGSGLQASSLPRQRDSGPGPKSEARSQATRGIRACLSTRPCPSRARSPRRSKRRMRRGSFTAISSPQTSRLRKTTR